MNTNKKEVITCEGLYKFESELNDLKVNKRREIAEKIKEAREQGDLSENAEYDAAKDEQRDIEARIVELESFLKNVEVIYEEDVDTDKIGVGNKVKLYDIDFDEEVDYMIVGTSEVDIDAGKISPISPVGKALMGAKVGDIVDVETHAGTFKYEVLDISVGITNISK
ncbi:MAG: transcription elongation factor GreA [Clostridiales bacterium]|nr:transcription elongation factor GreA [Clostridiales bacterium]